MFEFITISLCKHNDAVWRQCFHHYLGRFWAGLIQCWTKYKHWGGVLSFFLSFVPSFFPSLLLFILVCHATLLTGGDFSHPQPLRLRLFIWGWLYGSLAELWAPEGFTPLKGQWAPYRLGLVRRGPCWTSVADVANEAAGHCHWESALSWGPSHLWTWMWLSRSSVLLRTDETSGRGWTGSGC